MMVFYVMDGNNVIFCMRADKKLCRFRYKWWFPMQWMIIIVMSIYAMDENVGFHKMNSNAMLNFVGT